MIGGPTGVRHALVGVAVTLALGACAGGGAAPVAGPGTTIPEYATSAPTPTPTAAPGPAVSPPPTTTTPESAPLPDAVRTLLDAAAPLRRFSLGTDRLGVWICHVALDVTDPIYNRADLRLDLDPATVADLLQQYVGAYYRTLSGGRYRPEFVVGGEVSIAGSQGDDDCVGQAQEAAPADLDGVVVVADAEHDPSQPGGWGRPGTLCPVTEAACAAHDTGRATYVGASDFHPDWGPEPAVDLQEHEIGHSLGLPHSGDEERYSSAIDVMSNSAAPRDVDPDRRDGPDTLAVNRLALGWLPLDDVVVAPPGGGTFSLSPSNGPGGTRLLVLPLDDLRFVSVEVLADTGFDAHLPASGVAVHLIDQSADACRVGGATDPCLNEERHQRPLVGVAPYDDLLLPGESWTGEGWTVRVVADGPVWTLEIS